MKGLFQTLASKKELLLITLLLMISFSLKIYHVSNMEVPAPFVADARQYAETAINIAESGTFGDDIIDGKILINRLPGYPLLLSLIWSLTKDVSLFYKCALLANVILGCLSTLLIYQISRVNFSSFVAFIISLATALQPHLLAMEGYILNETLFTFEVILLVWLISFYFKKNIASLWVAIGSLTLYSLLTKPSFILFFIPVIIVVLLSRNQIQAYKKVLAYYILGIVICLLPWASYTLHHNVPFTGTKNDAGTFAAGFYPGLIHKDPRYYGFPYRDPAAPKDIMTDYGKAASKLGEWVKDDPGKYLRWFFIGKPLVLWQWDIIQGQGDIFVYRVSDSLFYKNSFFIALKNIYKTMHNAMFFLMIAGCVVVIFKRDSVVNMVIVSLLAYFFAVHIVFFSLPRYSIPLRPLMIYLDAYFISWFIKHLADKKKDWVTNHGNH